MALSVTNNYDEMAQMPDLYQVKQAIAHALNELSDRYQIFNYQPEDSTIIFLSQIPWYGENDRKSSHQILRQTIIDTLRSEFSPALSPRVIWPLIKDDFGLVQTGQNIAGFYVSR